MTAIARTMVLVLIASLMTLVSPISSSAACAEELSLDSYRIKLHLNRSVYEHGDAARISAQVVHKQTKQPIEDAYFAVGISSRDTYTYGVGKTDDDGSEQLNVRIRRYMKPGFVTLQAYAYKRHADVASCFFASEYGYKKIERAFRIKR